MTDQFVFEVLKQFNDSSIVDLDFSRDGTRLALKKKEACIPGMVSTAASVAVPVSQPVPAGTASAAPISAAAENTTPAAAATPEAPAEVPGETIKSPVVGTFYRAPSPDSPAYAEKGSKIKKGEPLCIIEAMKMMNTLTAEFDLEVLAVLPENGDLVEYDQPLFSVQRL
ncbi:MAG: acetyl-CoA carboxylase biotin carboxyl carrier protein [Treponemataceae bacterium]|nr:acetyl-CoA carboxylase biotin carboxyl carrier protein [Treponemataceae bacterium]